MVLVILVATFHVCDPAWLKLPLTRTRRLLKTVSVRVSDFQLAFQAFLKQRFQETTSWWGFNLQQCHTPEFNPSVHQMSVLKLSAGCIVPLHFTSCIYYVLLLTASGRRACFCACTFELKSMRSVSTPPNPHGLPVCGSSDRHTAALLFLSMFPHHQCCSPHEYSFGYI